MSDAIVINALEVNDFAPSMPSVDGALSHAATLFQLSSTESGVHIWKAAPGSYLHPGASQGETFIVLEGRASITIAGNDPQPIGPGSVVRIPPNTPSDMTVTALLQKVALNLH